MQLSREMSTLRHNCYFPGRKLYRRTDLPIYKVTNVTQAHSTPRVAWQSHRCVYPTHRVGTVTPACLPNTPGRHCHTGVYPTHLVGTVTPVCLPNTPGRHCHTGVSTQHTGSALSHRCVHPAHLPHNKSNKRFHPTAACFNPTGHQQA